MPQTKVAIVGAGLAGWCFSEAAMQSFVWPFFGGVTLDAMPARDFLFLSVRSIDRSALAPPRISDAHGRGIREISAAVTLCGDHLLTPSTQGAMLAGRHAAERARPSVAR